MTSTSSQPSPRRLTKVLIANRGEIAVRVARACADAGIATVAVYADSDRNALHVKLSDEAYALHGQRAAETYLDAGKLLDVARRSGADAVHPGYGFLSENAEFAQAVLDAGLVWIGPPPAAIAALGDKVTARHIAQRVGAPLVPGTADPVAGAEEVLAFADAHGLPVAIKAAFGGGGRGLKVARTREEIPQLYESAVREALAAFGRGECFVERFLDRPRHVETQCLADAAGTVVVVSTRDCSLQRRHQKLVEEAPAPFLSAEQEATLVRASQAILREAGYVGAGTCEFLVGQDGTISFLEVNTRLQVEHPVSEEVAGLDLVREQLRVAAGEELGYTEVATRGHSIELRINGEDPASNFMPAPGTIASLTWPAGPGVRVDAGVVAGDAVSGAFDSLLAKLIVTGATRAEALERARRALRETEIVGLPTVLPFHRSVLTEPDFTAERAEDFRVHTTWIETDYAEKLRELPRAAPATPAPAEDEGAAEATERVVVEVGGKRLEVVIPAGLGISAGPRGAARRPARRAARSGGAAANGANGAALTSPMQGTIVKVAVADGELVAEGDLVVVLEAMKMEQPLVAHRAGRVHGMAAAVGQNVATGAVICQIDPLDDVSAN
ncbi:acetyl/propionyl/methylcrotonyl-CoA carboxylase subunit alpha [Georgenia ruanii]|uniref:biotin carboxylase n=1 Tax=Georgenia ruanii TaxID=348442 RepID=A0A7J9UWB8_9MICO|nr:biotin carboxylase N-terminal domain-containing protein [Georgenia ruanii]MPV88180.1 ATP-grasp domain-containing protein [Georgenia ruanii]